MQIDPNSAFYRQRSYSEPLPKELVCEDCGSSYRISSNYYNAKSKMADFCSDECLEKIKQKNHEYIKSKLKEIVQIYIDTLEQKRD